MALSSNATSVSTTETPSTTLSTLSTTNSSSLFSSPISLTNKSGKYHPHVNMNNMNHMNGVNVSGVSSPTRFGPLSPPNHIESSLSTKDIVIQLRELAQNPHQQIHLINNTDSLRILSDSLLETSTRSSMETCIISLQTLQLLAINPNYRDTLKSIPNLSQRIDTLCLSSQQRLQTIAKHLRETINSKIALNKYQQYQPRPLHKIEFNIINLKDENDRDEIQTIGIKINGIISVTVNMSTRIVTFYTTRGNVKKTLAQSLRSNGFQVQTEEEKDFDDVCSVHSGISNFTDINNNKPQLSSLSLQHDGNNNNKIIKFRKQQSKSSIIQERYEQQENNDNDNNDNDNDISYGPTYIQPRNDEINRTGITKYRPKQQVMSLAQRLQYEQKRKDQQEKKQQKTQSFLTKVISYIW